LFYNYIFFYHGRWHVVSLTGVGAFVRIQKCRNFPTRKRTNASTRREKFPHGVWRP